jgi:cytochrome P450
MLARTTLRPPGPADVPLLGSSLGFVRDPIAFLERTARTYGDIAYFRLGSVNVFFASHPDLVKEVLITQRQNFTLSPLRERLRPVIGHGLFASGGELHATQRRLMQPVFRKSRIESYAEVMAALARRTRDHWAPGQEIDSAEEMMQLTMFVASIALFGHDIEDDADAVSKNMTFLLEHFTRLFSPFFSLLLKLPLPSTLRVRATVRDLDAVIYRMIERRRANPGAGDDLLTRLMQAKDDETQAQMTGQQLRDELLTLLIAGHETTANLLAWTLFLLAQAPDKDALVHAEAKAVLGGRPGFTAADADRLPYLRRVIMEGLRLYPPGWFIGRRALVDVRLGGYDVPKDSVVMLCQYLMQRDGRFYEDPAEFRPERWTEKFEKALPRGAFFPFSAGDRHCIGEGFAWQEALLILATLLERWRLELVPGQRIWPRPSVTLRPNTGIRMIVQAR